MADSQDRQVEDFWEAYLRSLSPEDVAGEKPYEVWSFGDNPSMADRLVALVMDEVKTATCGLLWEYESEEEPLPRVGDLGVITDGAGQPRCVIETLEVTIRPFNQVEARFAYDEGEGDRTLEYWRAAHWAFFTRRCEVLGREPSPTMPLVCERFRMVFAG